MSLPDYQGAVCLINSAKMEVLIDAADLPLVSEGRWTVAQQKCWGYYAVRVIKGRMRLLHRYLLGVTDRRLVDHINRNGLDNRRANLRVCTPTQNNANRTVSRTSKSGYKGVWWHQQSARPWRAAIKVHGQRRYLGTFRTAEEAHGAYLLAAKREFGEFARSR